MRRSGIFGDMKDHAAEPLVFEATGVFVRLHQIAETTAHDERETGLHDRAHQRPRGKAGRRGLIAEQCEGGRHEGSVSELFSERCPQATEQALGVR